MSLSYLDKTGLAALWAKIKSYISSKLINYDSKFITTTRYSLSPSVFTGILTGSKATIYFTVPLAHDWGDNVSSVSLAGNFSIRHADGGYILNAAALTSIGTVTYYRNVCGLTVKLDLTNAASSFTNNSVITAYANSDATMNVITTS